MEDEARDRADGATPGRGRPPTEATEAPTGAASAPRGDERALLRSLRIGATLVQGLPGASLEITTAGRPRTTIGAHPSAGVAPCMLRGAIAAAREAGDPAPVRALLGLAPGEVVGVAVRAGPPSSLDLRGGCWGTRAGGALGLLVPTVLAPDHARAVADDALARRRDESAPARRRDESAPASRLTLRTGVDDATAVTVLLGQVALGCPYASHGVAAARAVAAALVVEEALRHL